MPLKVAGAFHSPLMQAAADQMAGELEKAQIRTPTKTVYSNVTAQPHGDPASIKQLLVDQIVEPGAVGADDANARVGRRGAVGRAVPGRTLTGLLKRINRRLPIESFATAADATKK